MHIKHFWSRYFEINKYYVVIGSGWIVKSHYKCNGIQYEALNYGTLNMSKYT